MAAIGVLYVEDGWAGDIKRKRVILDVGSATTDTLTLPELVGLHEILGIKATGRYGTINGQTVVACSHVTWLATTGGAGTIICYQGADADAALSNGNVEVFIYGR